MGTQPRWRAHFLSRSPAVREVGACYGLTLSFNDLPGLNATVLLALILTGSPVCAGAGTAMALQEGAEAHQRDAILAMQSAGDFFENGVENAIGLFFGEICFFRDGSGEFWFTHE
jgi:hypothetical protein